MPLLPGMGEGTQDKAGDSAKGRARDSCPGALGRWQALVIQGGTRGRLLNTPPHGALWALRVSTCVGEGMPQRQEGTSGTWETPPLGGTRVSQRGTP